mmetsp:Transcript_2280/g.3293  ORF Transcript_2280/g.3293 Transcript_2280/m.3293 type:complete len:82 (+) Transcript_2280:67-312(+)
MDVMTDIVRAKSMYTQDEKRTKTSTTTNKNVMNIVCVDGCDDGYCACKKHVQDEKRTKTTTNTTTTNDYNNLIDLIHCPGI